jgi:hypothetical protein
LKAKPPQLQNNLSQVAVAAEEAGENKPRTTLRLVNLQKRVADKVVAEDEDNVLLAMHRQANRRKWKAGKPPKNLKQNRKQNPQQRKSTAHSTELGLWR